MLIKSPSTSRFQIISTFLIFLSSLFISGAITTAVNTPKAWQFYNNNPKAESIRKEFASCKKSNENKDFLTDSKDSIRSTINKLGTVNNCSKVVTPFDSELATKALALQAEFKVLDGNSEQDPSKAMRGKLQKLNVEYGFALNKTSIIFGFEMYLIDVFRRLMTSTFSALIVYNLIEYISFKQQIMTDELALEIYEEIKETQNNL